MKGKFGLSLFFICSLHAQKTDIFKASKIISEIKKRMHYSWRDDNPVQLKDLRYLQVTHWGYDDEKHVGELVVHDTV